MKPEHHLPLRESLGAHALSHLSEPEDRAVREHLDDCWACRGELAEIAPVVALLATIDPELLDLEPLRADPVDQPPPVPTRRQGRDS